MKIAPESCFDWQDFDGEVEDTSERQEGDQVNVNADECASTSTANGASTSRNAMSTMNVESNSGIENTAVQPDVHRAQENENRPSVSGCRPRFLPFFDIDDLMQPGIPDNSDNQGYIYAGLYGDLPLTDGEIGIIPTVAMSANLARKNKECIICIETFETDDLITKLPCSHIYHAPCIKSWLRRHGICPVCRAPLYGLKSYNVDEDSDADSDDSAEDMTNGNGTERGLDCTNNSCSESLETDEEEHNHDSSASDECSDYFKMSHAIATTNAEETTGFSEEP